MAEINWLEQVKKDAETITKRRLEDDGFKTHEARQDAINAAELASDSLSSGSDQVNAASVQPEAPTPESAAKKSAKKSK